jgi:hypothetical protein
MATYSFTIDSSDDSRQAGIIHSTSFQEALELVGERVAVNLGDTLEIGVKGFPPARYQCVEAMFGGRVLWAPANQIAA